MRIGVYFSQKKDIGGVYQYSLSVLESLKEEDVIIFNNDGELPVDLKNRQNFEVVNVGNVVSGDIRENFQKSSYFKKLLASILFKFRLYIFLNCYFKFVNRKVLKIIKEKDVDIMFFLTTDLLSLFVDAPVVVPIHDMAHREYTEFPEVSEKRIWQMREYVFSQIARKSFRVLVDSQTGKEDVVKYYHVDGNKIVVLPYVAPNYLNKYLSSEDCQKIIKQFGLPNNYFFYPAQFWKHKNHINIVKAIKILKDKHLIVNVVFCGNKKEENGEYQKVINFSRENNLYRQIYHLGYVDNSVMSALYKMADALVMPTFFGPTNIPILEAWEMGCPVIYSNIRGCKKQAGEAALLVDPNNAQDVALKMSLIISDKELRKSLIEKGTERLSMWTFEDFTLKVSEIINDFKIYGNKKS